MNQKKLLFLLFFPLFSFFYPTFIYTQTITIQATLRDIKGEVLVKKAGEKNWLTAQEDMQVKNGDKIKTRAFSEVKIIFDNKNIIKLTSYTEFTIYKTSRDTSTGAEVTSGHIPIGKLIVNIKKALAPGSSFEVSTPSTLVGVRSTKFLVAVDWQGNTNVVSYEGKVNVSAQGKEKEIEEGMKLKIRKGEPPGEKVPIDEKDEKEKGKHPDIFEVIPKEEKKIEIEKGDREEEKREETKKEEEPEKPLTLNIDTPQDNIETEEERIAVSGTTDPDTSVVINGISAPPDAFGKFEMTIQLQEGDNTITITATNPAGKTITITRKVKRLRKKIQPPPIIVPPLVLNVFQPPDNTITNIQTIIVSGTVTQGAKITVQGIPVQVDANGNFTQTISLSEGINTITIIAKDSTGATQTLTRKVILDTIPPFLTISTPSDFLITNNPSLQIIGFTETNAKVKIAGVDVSVESGGNFTKNYILDEGQNKIKIEATDVAGNKTTTTRTVELDTVPPILTIASPSYNYNSKDTPNVNILGFTEPKARIYIQGVEVYVDGNGKFEKEIILQEGKNAITIKAQDKAGNINQVIWLIRHIPLPPDMPQEPK